MVNIVCLLGRLGQDVELRETKGGRAVANFSLATSERWTDAAGQRQERTEWHNILVWGTDAENCKKYIGKGSMVFVQGSLQTREWTDRDGNTRRTTEVVSRNVRFVDKRESSEQDDMPFS